MPETDFSELNNVIRSIVLSTLFLQYRNLYKIKTQGAMFAQSQGAKQTQVMPVFLF